MAKRVDQTLSDLPLEEKMEALLAFLERELKPIVRRLRDSNNELAADFAGIDAAIAAIEASLDALETVVTGLSATVESLSTTVSEHTASIADHETRIDDLEAGEPLFKKTTHIGSNNVGGVGAGVTMYIKPAGWSNNATTTVTAHQMLVPGPGVFKNMRAKIIVTSADTDTFDLALVLNGSVQALKCVGMSGDNTNLFTSDATEITVADGDLWCIAQTNPSAGISGHDKTWAVDFEASS